MRTLVVGAAVLLVGCGSEPTAPFSASTTREIQEFTTDFSQVSDCAGEPIEFALRERVTTHEQTLADGRTRLHITVTEAGSTGRGLVTGRQWRAVGSQQFTFTATPGPIVDGFITGTSTGRTHTQLTFVSRGAPSLHVSIQFSYTQEEFFDPSTGESDTNILKESFRQRVLGCR